MKNILFFAALIGVATIAQVDAECANACSGHGFCGEYDMCVCNRNYRGADCSERVCPYGHAFVTTPQGDLNSDGDRADNSWKRLSQPVKTFKINSDTITLAGFLKQTTDEVGATNQHRGEVGVGDTIRIGNQVMEVTQCQDSTATTASTDGVPQDPSTANIAYACDRIIIGWGVGDFEQPINKVQHHLNRHDTVEFGGRAIKDWSGYSIYKYVRTQTRPQGTWEAWPGDFYGSGHHDGAQDEGHFYMECSNRGVCDRKTGECECFDGYTGLGCSRLACPENCAGHGTCQTVEQMASKQPTLQSFTVQTYKDNDRVDCEIDVSSLISANDYVKIGPHAPMKVESVHATHFKLYSEFPESLPYGTHIWKVHQYGLWDANKNTACKCDAMWTGNDCSLRKCPYGDDPLTVVSYDMEQEGTGATTAGQTHGDGSDSSKSYLYVGYSPYRQRAERQTLYIDSATHTNTGTFTLTFTDEYGDEWTTRPIPTVVRLSQTISTASTAHLDFGNTPGIHVSEVSIGDIIRVGQSYRKVTKLQYRQDDSNTLDVSRQYYQKIYFQEALLNATTGKTEQSASVYRTAGTPVYRVTVAKEIREALRALPNDRIPDVTVEAVTRGGAVLDQVSYGTDIAGTNKTIAHAADLAKRKVSVGDIIRFGNEVRQVELWRNPLAYDLTEAFGSVLTAGSTLYIQNGMKYDITFESGCRTHEDCRYNGVDENDSDGPPTDRLIEGLGTNAAYCHMGGTCMCSFDTSEQAEFYGPGCTKTGRGTHKNAKVTVSGDIYNLKCDTTVRTHNGVTAGLTPSYVLAATATVARISPQTITLSGSEADVKVGDHVRIEGQVRTVTSVSGVTVKVDTPFEEENTSDIVSIFPALTPVNLIKEIGGVRSTCTVSDLRRLSSSLDSCGYQPSSINQVSDCGKFSVTGDSTNRPDQENREVILTTSNARLIDEREVEIGDRIRVITSTGNWNTRTVDSVTYNLGEVDGFVVSEPFEVAATNLEMYNDGAGTTEAKVCSGRGLCDDSSGECQCFKGYSGVDCSRQNALAV